MYVGEAISGDDGDRTHVNVVLGPRDGPVGTAFATVLNSPTPKHVPFLVVATPNLFVRPATLFINRLPIEDEAYGTLIWGPVQLGTGLAIVDLGTQGVLPAEALAGWVVLVTTSLGTSASQADTVFANAYAATYRAVEVALSGERPSADRLRAALGNRFYGPSADTIAAARQRLAAQNSERT